jgi:hypothetical protein
LEAKVEDQIDYAKKISELTAGELYDLISNAVYQALLNKSVSDNKISLDMMKSFKP